MKRISLVLISTFCIISLLSVAGVSFAKGVEANQNSELSLAGSTSSAPGFSLGYTRMLGTTARPYIKDFTHLNEPFGLAVSGSDLWIAEGRGNRVLRYSNNGTYLGPEIGDAGFDNYQGKPINGVSDVAIDSGGNVWVASTGSSIVYKFDAEGNFLQQLGEWEFGSDNQHFGYPTGIAFDTKGNLYVADSAEWGNGNNRIQIFNSSGDYLNTIGETGVSGTDNNHFNGPVHIAIDELDTLYVADRDNHRVQILDVNNPLSPSYVATIGVTGECGFDDNLHLCGPHGVAVDDNYIYIADGWRIRVEIYNKSDRTLAAILGGDDEFNTVSDVAVDANGNIYVADYRNYRVQMYNSSLVFVRSFGVTGVPYLTDGIHFNGPTDLAIAPDNGLLILELMGHRLVKLSSTGSPSWTFGTAGVAGEGNSHLNWPQDVTVDASGKVYVADNNNQRILILNSDGSIFATLGEGVWGDGEYQFKHPHGVAVGTDGKVYVGDSDNHRIQIYDSSRIYVGTIGVTGISGSDNSHLNSPRDVVIDSAGRIYVVDDGNNRIQVFNNDGTYLRTTGETGVWGNGFNQLAGSMHIALDAQDRLYVTDPFNARVLIYDSTGKFITLLGDGVYTGKSGPGQFDWVQGGAVDKDGNFFIADGDLARIVVFSPGYPGGWLQENTNGFGTQNNVFSSMAVLDNYMYAATSNWADSGSIWRTSDGSNWEEIAEPGAVATSGSPAIIKIYAYQGKLYAATGWGNDSVARLMRFDGTSWEVVFDPGVKALGAIGEFGGMLYVGGSGTDYPEGCQIWRSSTGNPGTWVNVVANGRGNTNNDMINDLITFGGKFYAAVNNPNDGFEIWQSTNGTQWTSAITGGNGSSDSNTGGFGIFNGQLYIGASHHDGGRLWRTTDGIEWNSVTSNGFGKADNNKIEAIVAFGNKAYALVGNSYSGAEIWRSSDGQHFSQFVTGGFGDPNNTGFLWANAVVPFRNSLFFATANNGGGEIWKMDFKSVFLPFIKR